MKRSDMVHEIAQMIESFGGRSLHELASQILKIQENAGMLPPMQIKSTDSLGHRMNNASLEIRYLREWEQE